MAKLFQAKSWTRGEVIELEFELVTGQDPTLYGMKYTMKPSYGQPPVLEKTTGGGQITVDEDKLILVAIPYPDSKALGAEVTLEYLFDLWRTDTGQDIQLARGKATIYPAVRDLP